MSERFPGSKLTDVFFFDKVECELGVHRDFLWFTTELVIEELKKKNKMHNFS